MISYARGSCLTYEYVDFIPEAFDYSYCNQVPYCHQLSEDGAHSKEYVELLKQHLSDDEQFIIIDQSYYFIHTDYAGKDFKNIPIEEWQPNLTVHANSPEIIKQYVKRYQGTFSFLMGNNGYRPHSDKLFRHAHLLTEVDGQVYKNTFTIIYPIHIVDEETEKFKIFFSEEEGLGNMMKAPLTYPEGEVTTVDFPKHGKALVLYFNSVNGIHWVEGLTNNNYMAHAFDSATLM